MVPLSMGKCEILYAKGLKFNHAHCRFAQHLIFLHHFSAEEKEFESVTPQCLDLLQEGEHPMHIPLQEQKTLLTYH